MKAVPKQPVAIRVGFFFEYQRLGCREAEKNEIVYKNTLHFHGKKCYNKCIQYCRVETEKGDVSPKMYEIDDLIMYGSTGVCKVSDITKPDFAGSDEDRLYYVLEPLYQSGVIYAPVDNEKVHMRPVISEDEAKNLIDNIPEIHTEIYKSSSMQQLTKYYQSIIDTHRCLDLLKLTKSIYMKQMDANKQNKHLGQIDKKFMKRAEDLLFGEFAVALRISREDVQHYVQDRLGEE